MSRTAHHNAPKRGKLVIFADKYAGWTGEQCWKQNGKAFIKRMQRRHNRHYQNACAREGVNEDTTTIPLTFESNPESVSPIMPLLHAPLPPVRWKRSKLKPLPCRICGKVGCDDDCEELAAIYRETQREKLRDIDPEECVCDICGLSSAAVGHAYCYDYNDLVFWYDNED